MFMRNLKQRLLQLQSWHNNNSNSNNLHSNNNYNNSRNQYHNQSHKHNKIKVQIFLISWQKAVPNLLKMHQTSLHLYLQVNQPKIFHQVEISLVDSILQYQYNNNNSHHSHRHSLNHNNNNRQDLKLLSQMTQYRN